MMPAASARPMPCAPAPESSACGRSASRAAPSSAPVAKLTRCGSTAFRRAAGSSMKTPATIADSAPQAAVRSRMGASVDTGAQPTSVEPGERGHAPGRAVAPEGKETHRVRVRAEIAAAHRDDAGRLETAPRQTRQAGEPAPWTTWLECCGGPFVLCQKRIPDFGADFEGERTDRRTEPGNQFPRVACERGN